MNCCDQDGNITNNTCPVTFSHSVIQQDRLACLSSTTLSITGFKLTFAFQQK